MVKKNTGCSSGGLRSVPRIHVVAPIYLELQFLGSITLFWLPSPPTTQVVHVQSIRHSTHVHKNIGRGFLFCLSLRYYIRFPPQRTLTLDCSGKIWRQKRCWVRNVFTGRCSTHISTHYRKEAPVRPKKELHSDQPVSQGASIGLANRSMAEGLLTGTGMTQGHFITEKPVLTRVTLKKAEFWGQCAPFTGISIGPLDLPLTTFQSLPWAAVCPCKTGHGSWELCWEFLLVYLLSLLDSQFWGNCWGAREWSICKASHRARWTLKWIWMLWLSKRRRDSKNRYILGSGHFLGNRNKDLICAGDNRLEGARYTWEPSWRPDCSHRLR